MPIEVQEISQSGLESPPNDVWRNGVPALPHAHRDTRNRFLG